MTRIVFLRPTVARDFRDGQGQPICFDRVSEHEYNPSDLGERAEEETESALGGTRRGGGLAHGDRLDVGLNDMLLLIGRDGLIDH